MNNPTISAVTSLHVRPARQADMARLRDIYVSIRRETFYWQDPARHKPEDFDRDTENELVRVVEICQQVEGFISWWPQENFIHHLYVTKNCRHRGAGSALLRACLENLERPAYLKCLTKNKQAITFYQNRGWRVCERGCSVHGKYYLMALD